MKVLCQTAKISTMIDTGSVMGAIEEAGRVCYKSEDKITDGSAEKFIEGIIKRGHEAVLEHQSITVKFVTDRAVTHELVRHRLASFCQESQRYCNYTKGQFGGEVSFIKPVGLPEGSLDYKMWENCCKICESTYKYLVGSGIKPEVARNVLPNSTKTEIVVTANIREWRHILMLRTSKRAAPQIRALMIDLLEQFKEKLPVLFSDIEVEK